METKTCSKCLQEKQIEKFNRKKGSPDGRRRICSACQYQQSKAYRATPEGRRKVRDYSRAYKKQRLKRDPLYRLIQNARTRQSKALKALGLKKSAHTIEGVGLSASEWMDFLEAQFQPGMTRENYGKVWHVDHRIGLALFDLSDPKQLAYAFHYSNTQPMFGAENLARSKQFIPCDLPTQITYPNVEKPL